MNNNVKKKVFNPLQNGANMPTNWAVHTTVFSGFLLICSS